MKKALITSAAVVLAFAGWWQANRSDHPKVADKDDSPPAVPSESAAIFQRAFWKRPAADDRILHASQWEQPDAGGAQRWFIAVEPSSALKQRLREENAFGLVASAKGGVPDDAPEWFKFDPAEMEPWVSASGGLRIYFSKNGGPLYATGTIAGFRPAHVHPTVAAAVTPQAAGRLPTTSPPSKP